MEQVWEFDVEIVLWEVAQSGYLTMGLVDDDDTKRFLIKKT